MIYYCSKFYHLELWWMGKSTEQNVHFSHFNDIFFFKFWSFFFCWYKLLITKSVKNNSFLPSLNWTFSGIYGDQCCSLIEILSPLCLAHSSFWVRLTFLFWPHPNSHNISEVSNRGFWIWSFREETPCYALTIN